MARITSVLTSSLLHQSEIVTRIAAQLSTNFFQSQYFHIWCMVASQLVALTLPIPATAVSPHKFQGCDSLLRLRFRLYEDLSPRQKRIFLGNPILSSSQSLLSSSFLRLKLGSWNPSAWWESNIKVAAQGVDTQEGPPSLMPLLPYERVFRLCMWKSLDPHVDPILLSL